MRNETIAAAALLCLSCGGGGGGSQGGSETWSGELTGTALGAFICISGTDASYDEISQLSVIAPSPGLVSLIGAAYAANLNGTFSNTETAHEASGFACAPPPSVASTTTSSTAVSVRALQNQLTVTSGGGPQPPGGVTGTPGNGSVTVSWSAVSGATSYNLYFARQSGVTPANYS